MTPSDVANQNVFDFPPGTSERKKEIYLKLVKKQGGVTHVPKIEKPQEQVIPSAPYNPANDPSNPAFNVQEWKIRFYAALTNPHENRNFWNKRPSYEYAKIFWIQLPGYQSVYHQIGPGNEKNMKFVSPDGHYEAVFRPDGTLVHDHINGGTYNYYFSPTAGNSIGNFPHLILDVIPYKIWDNGPHAP